MKKKRKHAKSKPTRKKSASKKRSKKAVRHDRSRRSKGKQKKSHRHVKRAKRIQKVRNKHKVSVSSRRQVRKGKGKVKGRRSKTQTRGAIVLKHPRNKHQIELAFKGVRKIEYKIELVADSESFETLVERQLNRKGGRPPLGFIVIVEDDAGHTATRKSNPARHVDVEYVVGTVKDLLEELKDNYDPDLYDAEEDGTDFANANPDRIIKIIIKFFYGK